MIIPGEDSWNSKQEKRKQKVLEFYSKASSKNLSRILLAAQTLSSPYKKKSNSRRKYQGKRKWISLVVHYTLDDHSEERKKERKENEEELILSKAGKENFKCLREFYWMSYENMSWRRRRKTYILVEWYVSKYKEFEKSQKLIKKEYQQK